MRITQQSLINNFLKNLNDTNNKLFDVNAGIASGKRVERPEDDAVSAATITRINAQLAETDQFKENVMQSLSELNTIDSTFGEISSIITRTRELAVQGANATLSQDERDAIGVEVNQLLETLVQIGNSTVGGSILFSGHEAGSKPFEVVRGSDVGEVKDIVTIDGESRVDLNANNITRVVYKGDGERSQIEVDNQLTVNSNITGEELFFYDTEITNNGPRMVEKAVSLTNNALLENIFNAKESEGISKGYLFVRNSRGLTLREDTNPENNIDNSTPLSMLNNGRGVGRDNMGNVVGLGDVTLTDSAGTTITFNTNVAPLNTDNATIQDVVTFLNSQTYDPVANPARPRLRFFIESDQIVMKDNAKGAGRAIATDQVTDNPPAQTLSTFIQDLGLASALQPKTINAATTPVGLFNEYGGVRFSNVEEKMRGQLQFTGGADYLEILPDKNDGQKFVYDDGAGNRTPITLRYHDGAKTIDDVINALNAQTGLAKAVGNVNTAAGTSYFEVPNTDGTTERVEINAIIGGGTTDAAGNAIAALPGLAGATLDQVATQVRTRLVSQDSAGQFTVYLNDGTTYDFNLGDTNLNQSSTLQDVVNALNAQSNLPGHAGIGANGFQLTPDGQKIEVIGGVWGAPIDSVLDSVESTVALDLGILNPSLTVKSNFPNIMEENEDFPGITFDGRTLLSEWTGKFNISSSVNNGQVRVQDSAGNEVFVGLGTMHDQSTVQDFIDLFNSQSPSVEAQLSPGGYGIRFLDKAEGSGQFFVEDFGGSSLIEKLGIGTPNNGTKDIWDAGAGALVDLNTIGDLVLTVDDLVNSINQETEAIGVKARVDEVTGQLVFQDVRNSDRRGDFRITAENAVGTNTLLENLNDGGGINNYKIRVTDSRGVSTVIDFQDANTVEDVINSINISNQELNEKSPLSEIEGVTFPLGTVRVSSSTGSVDINLGALNESSTVQDMIDLFKGNLGNIQADANLRLNLENRLLQFEFSDLLGGTDNGTISISDVTGNSAAEFKLVTVAQGSPFVTGELVHQRAQVKASLNDERTGIKLEDLNGGELRITEVEGRTTAHDLGLIGLGSDVGTSVNGVLRGKNLNVFEKLADELGVSRDYGRSVLRSEDIISPIDNFGGINDEFSELRSVQLRTRELNTLKGSVDMNHALNLSTKIDELNNATPSIEYDGNPIVNVDMTGVLKIESLLDDGNNTYQKLVIDFKDLPDNATYEDLDRLIQQEIAADDRFNAKVQTLVTTDGRLKFISDYPIRVGKDDNPATARGTAALGASTMEDLFGTGNLITDFNHTIETSFLDLKRPMSGGIDHENFVINDFNGNGSLEVDMNKIAYELQNTRRGLQMADVKDFIENQSLKPALLTNSVTLKELGLRLPPNIPFDAANPQEVDTVAPFNAMTESSTLGDFITAFNASGVNSIFNGNVSLEIASTANTITDDEVGRRILVRDQTGLANGANLQINGIPQGVQDFLDDLGIKMGGLVAEKALGVIGIMGDQITGLGYKVNVDVHSGGQIALESEGLKDVNGKRIPGSGRMTIVEGRGSTATDMKLILGTGAIGDETSIINSGNLNPGLERNSLLSGLNPNDDGFKTSFANQLRSIYIENGKDSAFIELSNPTVTMDTPFKAFQEGRYDQVAGINLGGVDVGRPASGFVIQDQFGNEAIVDFSNNLSRSNPLTVANLTATDVAPANASPVRLTGAAGDFTNAAVGQFLEIATDGTNNMSHVEKYRITNIDPAGGFIEIDADPADFGTGIGVAGNYSVDIHPNNESLYASMEKDYRSKSFYDGDATLRDLQTALNIAIDKAKRTSGFGVDRLDVVPDESGSFRINVFGQNGPTVTLTERDINGDGVPDSSTAGDLGLLREVGAKGNGSPEVTAGPLRVTPTMGYVLDRINNDLSDLNVTASIGTNSVGPTLDITSNQDSSYIKIRDTQEGNTASQLGMSSTRSIFQTLIDFRDSLFRNDSATISDSILSRISDDEEKVLQLRAQVGSIVNRFEVNVERLDNTTIELTKRLSDHQDLDLTEAIIDLRKLETAQRAALSVGSRVIQQTLLDFLG